MKNDKFNELLSTMGKCTRCLNIKSSNKKDCSLINIYKDQDFCRNIPSIWTDWFNRLDLKIMVIGQDWGPYNDMKRLYELYSEDPNGNNWKRLNKKKKSNTKKLLDYYIKE